MLQIHHLYYMNKLYYSSFKSQIIKQYMIFKVLHLLEQHSLNLFYYFINNLTHLFQTQVSLRGKLSVIDYI